MNYNESIETLEKPMEQPENTMTIEQPTTKPVFDVKAYLEGLHTKQLLALRKSIYRVSPWSYEREEDSCQIVRKEQRGGVYYLFESYSPINSGVTIEMLREVLAKREHVPNKAEAKALRRERAFTGKRKTKHVNLSK